MQVYIPFKDGSSISFDGKSFTIHKKPNDINAVDVRDTNLPCKAEIAWSKRWNELVRALENSWKKQRNIKKMQNAKKIYKPGK